MKRIMKDYRSISDDHMRLIKQQYPEGFSDSDLVTLKTSDGSYFDALEVHTDDAVYLVKVNHNLLEAIDQFEENDFSEEVDDVLEGAND
ncbi:MAG: hypothetical protein HKN32_10090 [Flavobacteriales bacterium]|nr:hypothetical protein [Flavobacteriales bacterium]